MSDLHTARALIQRHAQFVANEIQMNRNRSLNGRQRMENSAFNRLVGVYDGLAKAMEIIDDTATAT